jgi:hypothetical protein
MKYHLSQSEEDLENKLTDENLQVFSYKYRKKFECLDMNFQNE